MRMSLSRNPLVERAVCCTSSSSPVVAAVAAMALGYDSSLTPAQLAQRLQDTKRKPMLEPWDWGSGSAMGMVDAHNAVTGVMP